MIKLESSIRSVLREEINNVPDDRCGVVLDLVSRISEDVLPGSKAFIVGSRGSGLQCNESDIDVTIITDEKYMVGEESRKMSYDDQINILEELKKLISFKSDLVRGVNIPVLKFVEPKSMSKTDLSLNSIGGVRNTIWLRILNDKDCRFRQLVVVVKCWAKSNGIYGGDIGMFPGYAWTLLIVAFLNSTSPSIIPNLFERYPDKFSMNVSIVEFLEYKSGDFCPDFISLNESSVSELFIAFIEYMKTKFNEPETFVTLRAGVSSVANGNGVTPKNSYLYIEEPFLGDNVGARLYSAGNYDKIKDIFANVHDRLNHVSDSGFIDDIFK